MTAAHPPGTSSRVVVVGSSVAGVRTAQALRAEGYQGDVLLVGEENELPYDKPPLSKGMLVGGTDVESIRLLSREQAAQAGIELLLGHRALRIQVAERRLLLADHDPVGYDHLVIATGARARPSRWGSQPGVHLLRTLTDAAELRADLLAGGPVVVVGGGFVGAEVASAARTLGLRVTVVDPLPVPMGHILNEQIGGWFADLHRRHGVDTRFGTGVEAIDGERGAFRVRLTDGSVVPAATVVVGVGAQPNDEWVADSGLLVDDGVVCDEYCRAAEAVDVYAAGDVARWMHPHRRVSARIEHWTNAVEQAACVAHNLAHPDDLRAYAPVEYVWSDQHDWAMQVVGRTGGPLEHVVLGDRSVDDRFVALYTGDGTELSGAVVVNWPRALVVCRRALRDGARLAEVRTRIEQLAPPGGPVRPGP